MIEMERRGDALVATFTGKVTRTDIAEAMDAIRPLAAAEEDAKIVVDLSAWDGIEADAVTEDIRSGFALWGDLRGRMAIVAENEALRAVAGAEGAFWPGLRIKGFAPDRSADAVAWAGAASDAVADDAKAGGGLAVIPTNEPGFMEVRMDGRLGEGDVARFGKAFAAADAETGGKVRLLNTVAGVRGFDPAILTSAAFLDLKTNAARRISRYAIVGGPAALTALAVTIGRFMPLEIKRFSEDEADAARAWLKA